MVEWIGETFTSKVGWNHLETLVDIGDRMAGSDGERRAAEATRDAFTDLGARNARLDPFEIQGWTRGSSSIRADATGHETIALPRSPAGSATGSLVDVGYGLPEDFKRDIDGKVVMVATNVPEWSDRFIHRREKYHRAEAAGAIAFVFRNHVEGCLAPTGSIGTADEPIGGIPAVGVSKEVGARLHRRNEGDDVTVTVDADIHEATSHNVHADLGPETDEAVLVTSHVDAHDIAEGAGDNGAGTAMIVEIANALAHREGDLDTRVHLIAYGAEEVGLCGSTYDSERREHEHVKAILNNDGVGRGRTLSITSHGFDGVETAVEAVEDRFEHPITVKPRLGPHSDHWPYVQWGVPGCHVMSETDYEGRGWGHTRADTLDKLEIRNHREQAVLLAELTVELAAETLRIEPRDPVDIAEQLEAEDLATGIKMAGEWPY